MKKDDVELIRGEFLRAVRLRLIGPESEFEELREKPNKRYLCGMLFPKGAGTAAASADEEELADDQSSVDESENQELESPTDLLFQKLPASTGMTFALERDEKSVSVEVNAARYERTKADVLASPAHGGKVGHVWKRHPLVPGGPEKVVFEARSGHQNQAVLQGRAAVHIFIRTVHGVGMATVSLVNAAEADPDKPINVEDLLFQVEIACRPSLGVAEYPDPTALADDPEARELALQYRSLPTYAVGHGCAAEWTTAGGTVPVEVHASFMPAVEVPPVTTEIASLPPAVTEALSMARLQRVDFDPLPAFRLFVQQYDDWLRTLRTVPVGPSYCDSRAAVLVRIEKTISRMRGGIQLLEDQPEVMRLFRKANRAMLLSVSRASANRGRKAGDKFKDVDLDLLPDDAFKWRPFQLAFFLLSLQGLWDSAHPDRSIVDLIWFPTGGGKTEAYLAIAAFEMLRRRSVHGATGNGTAVIKRYTLRLLTIQQFERAGSLICALETLRKDGEISGAPFSLGLWVGKESAPNDYTDAAGDLKKILNTIGKVEGVKVPLKHCPCCGHPILPAEKVEGDQNVGLRDVGGRIDVFCPRPECGFHELLPIRFVDDDLYDEPPTMLLGTIDKFAMLAWRDEARAFFGDGESRLPPSLIIQDELHLISGPLGTLAGVYEAAIDTAICQLGPPAKYICATATIRRSDEQIEKLYGRKSMLFPPPGLDASDSFFSRAQNEHAGRLYVGLMGQGHTPTFSNVIASSAVLAAGADIRATLGDMADTWWTVVSYHNSKRELGKTLSLARDDIPARLRALGEQRSLSGSGVRELSANLKDSQIPEALHQLNIELPKPGVLDFVACTNMLSVGIDVQRLGLMIVNGQPKTVAEYIQASSRVGRDEKRLPGLVFALFSPSKPRDRSHYEFFSAFHKGFYRHVEPTSVTPFALPSQDRALHGAFVALVRMVSEVHANNAAARILQQEAQIRDLAEKLLNRIAAARDGKLQESSERLNEFLGFWMQRAKEKGANLRFQGSGGKQYASLMRPFRQRGEGRETLQSLRNVDTPLKLVVPMLSTGKEGG
ncbi:hypothetical protein GCM10027034_20000 [Ramlibacter solisilvae]|uniref:Helicase C-terminal domain-containing protein n=1 Tax=Ramlibacter tataouinensis TaxID=94132 RepID=A0A127JV81_9BURK|nr:helicase-related protein [Ramlibacter tataouinensis]AMO23917.1 hypothetical protein UC35_14915 [Ramlibacter tataouinensis]